MHLQDCRIVGRHFSENHFQNFVFSVIFEILGGTGDFSHLEHT